MADEKSRASNIADEALAHIIRDIRDRSGLGDTWSEIDVDTRNEIVAVWRKAIVTAIEAYS